MDNLNVVYRYQNTSITNDLVEFLFMYDKEEVISEKEIQTDFPDLLEQFDSSLVFKNKDHFEEFIQAIMDKLRIKTSYILAVDDYNLGLSNISHMNEIDSIFIKYAAKLELSDEASEGKGFFGKFFR